MSCIVIVESVEWMAFELSRNHFLITVPRMALQKARLQAKK